MRWPPHVGDTHTFQGQAYLVLEVRGGEMRIGTRLDSPDGLWVPVPPAQMTLGQEEP